MLAVCLPAAASPARLRPGSRAFIPGPASSPAARQGGRLLAGIEIALDRGFKTYWRTPGRIRAAAAIRLVGSENVADAEVLWPAPTRLRGCRRGLATSMRTAWSFPVLVQPQDPAKPVDLCLMLEYGVCKDICIPARAELALAPGPRRRSGARAHRGGVARVPATNARRGATASLPSSASSRTEADKPTYRVRTAFRAERSRADGFSPKGRRTGILPSPSR